MDYAGVAVLFVVIVASFVAGALYGRWIAQEAKAEAAKIESAAKAEEAKVIDFLKRKL